jgi:uncharacterized protein (DUF58 family)
MKLFFISVVFFLALQASAQPSIKVEVSADTVVIGDNVEVTYTIENGEGQFKMPDLKGLPVISGPNSSSSFLYQDGKSTSSQSYSFLLRPLEEGKLIIPMTSYQDKEEKMTIQPVEIIVVAQKDKPVSPKSITQTPAAKPTREKRKF